MLKMKKFILKGVPSIQCNEPSFYGDTFNTKEEAEKNAYALECFSREGEYSIKYLVEEIEDNI